MNHSFHDLVRRVVNQQQKAFTAWDIADQISLEIKEPAGLIVSAVSTALYNLTRRGQVVRLAGGGMGRTVLYAPPKNVMKAAYVLGVDLAVPGAERTVRRTGRNYES